MTVSALVYVLCSLIFPSLCFLFCSLKENLHTYLTSWLSLCPVAIFFEIITIIVNPKFINKRVTHKMCNPKINSHQVVSHTILNGLARSGCISNNTWGFSFKRLSIQMVLGLLAKSDYIPNHTQLVTCNSSLYNETQLFV